MSPDDSSPARVSRIRGGSDDDSPYLHPGVFSRIPTVRRSQEMVDSAFRHAGKITVSERHALERVRKTEAARVRSVQNGLVARLQKQVSRWPSFDRLSPFYQDLAHLLTDLDRVRKALGAIDWASKRINQVGDEATSRIRAARQKEAMQDAKRHAYGRIASLLDQVDRDLAVLGDAREQLRRLPTIDPNTPTIVVAGYPNVGKSSLIRRVSTAAPEVASYPFTTKGVAVGVFDYRRVRYQLVDTPGLLDRDLDERNAIEMQAVLALGHLADVILFMLDPSEFCGYPMEAQLRLLEEVRRTFPEIPVIVVENKVDVKRTEVPGRYRISTETGEGIDELVAHAVDAVQEHRIVG